MKRIRRYILYNYITDANISFTITAKQYIRLFKRVGFHVFESYFRNISFDTTVAPSVIPIIHPFFYAVINFNRASRTLYNYIAIDVCESETMGPLALQYIKIPKMYILPSKKCVEVYKKYIPNKRLFYLPHMIEEEYLQGAYRKATSTTLIRLLQIKQQKELVYVGYIAKHSWWRKGVDILIRFFNFFKHFYKNSKLILLTNDSELELIKNNIYTYILNDENIVVLKGDYTKEDLSLFFYILDIYPATSRGGAFEIPFLEATFHGAIVPHVRDAPWGEYLPEKLGVTKYNRTTVHVNGSLAYQLYGGPGWEPNPHDLVFAVTNNSLKELKQIVEEHRQFLLENYTIEGNIERARNILESISNEIIWTLAK